MNSAININNCQLISKTAKELAVVAKINKDSSVLIDKAAEYLKLAVDKTTNEVSYDKIVFICTSCENPTGITIMMAHESSTMGSDIPVRFGYFSIRANN